MADEEPVDSELFGGLDVELWDEFATQHEQPDACDLILEYADDFDLEMQCFCSIMAVDDEWFSRLGCQDILGLEQQNAAEARDAFDAWWTSRQ